MAGMIAKLQYLHPDSYKLYHGAYQPGSLETFD